MSLDRDVYLEMVIQSLKKAQRTAAIAHLRVMGRETRVLCVGCGNWVELVFDIRAAIAAFRALGVLPKPKERKPDDALPFPPCPDCGHQHRLSACVCGCQNNEWREWESKP